jgi:catechol 2,3-dioxygenase-like lactoylglutathione lyase family enzyme
MSLDLIVLRCGDLEAAREFYAAVGLRLVEEKHGEGPRHYSCQFGETVFELYPAKLGTTPARQPADPSRLGFRVDALDPILAAVQALGAPVKQFPTPAGRERKAVVLDPDGRTFELHEASAG